MTTLLKNAWIYTPQGVIEGGYVVIDEAAIVSVGAERPEARFDCEKDMSGKLLLPGLVNAHTHAAMTLLRGVGTDLPLQRWLFDSVFPVEGRMTAEDIRAGTALALLEMLACGTTSFSDMYFFPWEAAELVAVCGIKANLCYPVQAFDPAEPYEKNESARKLERFYKDWHNAAEGRIRVDGCLHAEYTCNPHVAAGTAAWCRQNGVRMHIHLSETKSEHDICIEKYGKTPAAWMNDLGVFDVPCAAAHCVWVTAEDRALLREKNVSVIHNPTSNMKLGSGFAPVPELQRVSTWRWAPTAPPATTISTCWRSCIWRPSSITDTAMTRPSCRRRRCWTWRRSTVRNCRAGTTPAPSRPESGRISWLSI